MLVFKQSHSLLDIITHFFSLVHGERKRLKHVLRHPREYPRGTREPNEIDVLPNNSDNLIQIPRYPISGATLPFLLQQQHT